MTSGPAADSYEPVVTRITTVELTVTRVFVATFFFLLVPRVLGGGKDE